MSVTADVELAELQLEFDLEAYDYLAKGYLEAVDAVETSHAQKMSEARTAFKARQLSELEDARRVRKAALTKQRQEAELAAKHKAEAEAAEAGEDVDLEALAAEETKRKEEAAALAREEDEAEERHYQHELDALPEFVEDPTPKVDLSLLDSNAFCISLFCLEKRFEARSRDMLAYAFEQFPDKDYCIVTLPYTAEHFCLLHHFTPVAAPPNAKFSHVLYLFHRAALLTPVVVSMAAARHRPDTLALTEGLASHDLVRRGFWELCRPAAEDAGEGEEDAEPQDDGGVMKDPDAAKLADKGERAWREGNEMVVAEVEGQVVAVLVTRRCDIIAGMVKHFDVSCLADLELYDADETLELVSLTVNPIFTRQVAVILQETMRLLGASVVLHRVQERERQPEFLYHDLDFVRPRRQPSTVPPEDIEEDMTGLDAPSTDPVCVALQMASIRSLTQRKTTVDARIVVVGASDAGMGCIEALLQTPNLHLRNLTLVSHGGIATGQSNRYGVATTSFAPCELSRQAFHLRLQVVDTMLCGIDRKTHSITLNNGMTLQYDMLVLTPGLQDYVTDKFVRGIEVEGVFSPHNATTAKQVDEFVLKAGWLALSDEKSFVYGDRIDALSAVQRLLELGVDGRRITLALPGTLEQLVPVPPVADLVRGELAKANVTVSELHQLSNIETSDGALSAVTFKVSRLVNAKGKYQDPKTDYTPPPSPGAEGRQAADSTSDGQAAEVASAPPPEATVPPPPPSAGNDTTEYVGEERFGASMLLSFGQRRVNPLVFKAVNDNSLVFDGRLVVDGCFRTNDPRILGGGCLVKFQRRLLDRRDLNNYNSREAGRCIAASVLRGVIPEAAPPETDKAPTLAMPRGVVGTVPGGRQLLVLQATTPSGLNLLRDGVDAATRAKVGSENGLGGRELETHGPRGYMKLELDAYGKVFRITTLTPAGAPIVEPWSWTTLIGLPAATLNDLVKRVDNGTCTDMVDFLQEPWVKALVHDGARDIGDDLLEQLYQLPEVRDVLGLVRSRIEADGLTAERVGDAEGLEGLPSVAVKHVEAQLMDFLTRNSNHLAMFLTADRADMMNKPATTQLSQEIPDDPWCKQMQRGGTRTTEFTPADQNPDITPSA